MTDENAKQVVILKNIQSNYIEEAILILKSSGQTHKKKLPMGIAYTQNSDHIVQEAQRIIEHYVKKQYGNRYNMCLDTQRKTNKGKKWNGSVGMMLNIALFVSITVFILLLARAI